MINFNFAIKWHIKLKMLEISNKSQHIDSFTQASLHYNNINLPLKSTDIHEKELRQDLGCSLETNGLSDSSISNPQDKTLRPY